MFFVSIRFSHLLLKIGLAVVFLWFGIHKFIAPQYWINAWIPQWLPGILDNFGLSALNFIYINGVFEILVAVSLLTGVGVRVFALLASLFLLAVISTYGLSGFNEIMVRDIGLLGAMLSVLFWPERDHI